MPLTANAWTPAYTSNGCWIVSGSENPALNIFPWSEESIYTPTERTLSNTQTQAMGSREGDPK